MHLRLLLFYGARVDALPLTLCIYDWDDGYLFLIFLEKPALPTKEEAQPGSFTPG